MFAFGISPHMPCEECGASVHRDERDTHECDPERKREYEMSQIIRDEIMDLDSEAEEFFSSPDVRLDAFLAERNR